MVASQQTMAPAPYLATHPAQQCSTKPQEAPEEGASQLQAVSPPSYNDVYPPPTQGGGAAYLTQAQQLPTPHNLATTYPPDHPPNPAYPAQEDPPPPYSRISDGCFSQPTSQ